MPDHAVLSAQTAEDCVVDQHWERYDAEDHAIWRTLFERQQATLKDHVCEEYLKGLSALDIGAEGVPPPLRRGAFQRHDATDVHGLSKVPYKR